MFVTAFPEAHNSQCLGDEGSRKRKEVLRAEKWKLNCEFEEMCYSL